MSVAYASVGGLPRSSSSAASSSSSRSTSIVRRRDSCSSRQSSERVRPPLKVARRRLTVSGMSATGVGVTSVMSTRLMADLALPAGRPVDELAQDVGVAGVAGRLLEQVHQHPAEADGLLVAVHVAAQIVE